MKLAQIHSLARVSACIAAGDETRLKQELQTAMQDGISVPVIRETILQSYLFAGYAAAINAFIVLNNLTGANSEFFREDDVTLDDWKRRGTELCQTIYGDQFQRLQENMRRLHPDLAEWMIWEGYGKVLSRPFLTPRVRELLIVAMTAVLQVERQFYSHVRGAIHVGATGDELMSVFHQITPFLNETAIPAFEKILNDLALE